ncbi:hypothetical protein MtrunA17_Chr6g0465861 [Medicago truncatula]|uniref:CBS domain-containing protein n=1 Tax=Medicago truncatula TaxID=3880 RepID=A0A396HHA0_MEDTR|nr:hypothetical protein MtrunA17_Chr6g0465861 [Medicago truncatula]
MHLVPEIQGIREEKYLKATNNMLFKLTTISKGKSVSDACRRMAARHVDVVLLTDANASLFGMLCYLE